MEKKMQVRAGKLIAAERKKWQAKGKARLIETMSVGIQSDFFVEDEKKPQVEVAVQTEEESTVQMKTLKGKKGGVIELDVIMEDRSDMYEDLSGYEDEEGIVASLATLKQKVTKRSRVTKNKRTICLLPSGKKVSTSAFVVHGIPTMRPMSETIQDVKKTGLSGVVGARWLLGEYRRVGKLTSSLVIFLDPKAKVTFDEAGSWIKLRGRKLSMDAYDFDRGKHTGLGEPRDR
ncbi:hypothetical protein EV426DRAFT_674716 [Tirmania nivea]|nr:hypothetical protein EV426DRAFT_674716 [Tirmania nivea]